VWVQINAARAATERAKVQERERAALIAEERDLCPVCVAASKNMAFQCGHQVCV
jgi:hypothetical protein